MFISKAFLKYIFFFNNEIHVIGLARFINGCICGLPGKETEVEPTALVYSELSGFVSGLNAGIPGKERVDIELVGIVD